MLDFISGSKKEGGNSRVQLVLSVHRHRVFRGFFVVLLVLHMLLLLVPWVEIKIPAWPSLKLFFRIAASLWPFPTFNMLSAEYLHIRQLLMKTLEISVILLYTVDLLPKIFIWRQHFLWKLANIVVLSLMMFHLPITIKAYDKVAQPDTIKLRMFSFCLCFVLVCEILSIREQKTLRILMMNQRSRQQKQRKLKEYSWCEIVKHDRPGDCWVVIKSKVYDLSDFVDRHPGGDIIYDGAGGDCTAAWYSYHPSNFQDPPQQYCIGTVRDYDQYYSYDGNFYLELKQEVERSLPKRKWQSHWQLYVKAAICLLGYLASLYYFVTETTALSAVLLGFFAAQADVNIMHDGNHAAFSPNKSLSRAAGYVLDLTFSTSVVYRRSHNFGHHSCVNHLELDRAFDTSFPYLRLHPLQQRKWYHAYQHIYVWALYALVNFSDAYGTFDEIYWLSNQPSRRGYVSIPDVVIQVCVKVVWMYLTVFVPTMRESYTAVFPIWMLYMVVHGYNYALYFAVNHWTYEAGVVDNSNIRQTNWGVLQVQNSSNFGNNSYLWTHLSGGLNYQIEHHLFPQFAHTRLPEIKPIVMKKAKEYGIQYMEYGSFWGAIQSHLRWLKYLGSSV